MTPDDPRHGTNAGYIAHAFSDRDYCEPCRRAHVRKRKENKLKNLRGEYAKVNSTGTVRRVQALLALGHTHADIANAAGGPRNISKNVVLDRYGYIHIDVAKAVERAYAALSMIVPAHWRNRECARRAKGLGYVVPLAWDDIDDPDARPHGTAYKRHLTDLDPVAVERAMAGDRIDLTKAERFEVVARLRNMGLSLRQIEDRTVITKAERYIVREAS